MPYIVVKFGGSNLRNREDLHKIVNIIDNYKKPLIIVVSAFYGITNQLIDISKDAIHNKDAIDAFINKLHTIKKAIVVKFIKQETHKTECIKKLEQNISKLQKTLIGTHYLQYTPTQSHDKILATGEILSAIILYYILIDCNKDCSFSTPEEIGLTTNGIFKNAEIDLKKSTPKLRKNLNNNKITIIPGFYGISPEGDINLLGRGGTDYSAAALAHCVDAESLDIWKDVNGFCSADPKFIENTQSISHLSYNEAAELAYFGAKILHPNTILPAQLKNIPIRILDIRNSKTIKPKSIITSKTQKKGVKSITSSNEFGVLKLKGVSVGLEPNILSKITKKLNANDINISSVITSQIAINILLNIRDLNKAEKLVTKLDIHSISNISKLQNISLIAIIGNEITKSTGIASRIFGATAKANINIQLCSLGASDVSIYLIIDSKDEIKAVKIIHQELFS